MVANQAKKTEKSFGQILEEINKQEDELGEIEK